MKAARTAARLIALALSLLLAACGGGGGGGSSTASSASASTTIAANVVSVTVESGPGGNVNIPFTSVTVCVPGSTSCQTIDHVLIDTGSVGLRLLASAFNSGALPGQHIGSSSTILECAGFLSSTTWGPVKLADVVLANERAASVPIQVIADPAYTIIPSSCPNASLAVNTASDLGANGILGVGLFTHDGQIYYNCAPTSTATNCQISPTASQQVQNPVALFPTDNNGVILQLPAVAPPGVVSVSGSLTFGIGTQSNNGLGSAKIVPANANGYFTTVYKGVSMANSFFDSGSNGLYFRDSTITQCTGSLAGFYCPASVQNLSATVALSGGATATVGFGIDNALSITSTPYYALPQLGGTMSSQSFDWGLPFFFGRSVYYAISGRSTSAGTGPFYAYTN